MNMNQAEFLSALRDRLAGVSEADLQGSLDYYAEILSDMTEGGMSEAEAVASLGSVDAVAAQILLDLPLPQLVKARVKPRRAWRAWEIVLLAVGAHLWAPILLALAVVVLAVYIVLLSVSVSLYVADLCLAVGFLAGSAGSIYLLITGNPVLALLFLGAGLICAGLAIFGFFGCRAVERGILWLGKLIWRGIKSCFVRKEGRA